ncbi:MAG: aspartate--tRNA ligase [Deltaproteobacteria bacterium]|nr:aspartate--tRNA ligase [Deltaproteobacteria bacterium]MBN2671038.1 aspartate--tRNA ligase [Deltaproteobacteria bacterium]
MNIYRTHTCGALRKSDIGTEVVLSGWLHNRRDHGGVFFIDLRDHYGITQLVVQPESTFFDEITHLQKENVIRVEGVVERRDDDTINPKIDTGEVEVLVSAYEILGPAEPLPFAVFPEDDVAEDLRLKYRFLDLRRSELHKTIKLRSDIIARIRQKMVSLGFTEYQTPILTASSPEGARDFLVPSRLNPGSFYALPQAPQQFKQLLMVAGFDRYFQIAPCFRDEDARANRSPGEFYQVDIEMSFVEQDEVFAVIEELFADVFTTFSDKQIDSAPFVRIPYEESMLKYGNDKPDLRNPIVIREMTDIFDGSGFSIFANQIKKGAIVRALPVKGVADNPKKFFNGMIDWATSDEVGAGGLAYLIWKDDEIKGPIAKVLSKEELDEIGSRCDVGEGDVVFFVCDEKKKAVRIASKVRNKLGVDLNLLDPNVFKLCWIVDYPMYEENEDTGAVEFSHNPFSMPQGGMDALLNGDPLSVLAYQYDIVCNGEELSSGAIRNHRPDVMYKAFEIGGYTKEEVDEKFGGMINALKLGAPPHGGIAPGLDRLVMLIAGKENLREVVAFPMNQRAQDLMMGAPRPVSERQLIELSIRHELPDDED